MLGCCDFETGFCTWTNNIDGDDVNWILDTGGTPSGTTGPTKDHTLGTSLGKLLALLYIKLKKIQIKTTKLEL